MRAGLSGMGTRLHYGEVLRRGFPHPQPLLHSAAQARRRRGHEAAALTKRGRAGTSGAMRTSFILSEPLAGLQAQARGLAEAAGLQPEIVDLRPRPPWSWVAARMWPAPLRAVDVPELGDAVVFSAGGTAGVVGAALRRAGRPVVQIQHPRIDPARFDVVVVNRHDGLTAQVSLQRRAAARRRGRRCRPSGARSAT